MKKIIILFLIMTAYLFSQSWNSIVTTTINEPNLVKIDLFTNEDGNHIIVQNSNSTNSVKYYLLNSSGTIVRTSTIETAGSAEFPNISGDNDKIYVVYKLGNVLRFKKSTNEGSSWGNAVDKSIGSNTCNGVDVVYNDVGLHVVYAMQDNGSNYETYYRKIGSNDVWGNREDVTGYGSEVGGFPTITVSENRVHVGYNTGDQSDPTVNQGNAKNRDKNNTSWQTPQLVFGNDTFRETVFARPDSLFDFYAALEDGMGQYRADLYVKRRSVSGTSWSSSTLLEQGIDVAFPVSTALSSDNTIHIVYGDVKVAYKNYDGEEWSSTQYISSGNVQKAANITSVSNDLYSVWKEQFSNYVKYRQYDADPLAPQNLNYSVSANNHPLLEWDENTEPDISTYKVYKKSTQEQGFVYLTTTSNNYYEDETETFPVKGGPGDTHNVWYYVKAVDVGSNVSTESNTLTVNVAGSQIEKKGNNDITGSVPEMFELFQNYPNPFNPSTQITYSLAKDAVVTVKVYDMLGTEIAKLINETQTAGYHTISFNAKDLSSGVYIYRITVTNNGRILFTDSNQMILLR